MTLGFGVFDGEGCFQHPEAIQGAVNDALDEALDRHECGVLSHAAYVKQLSALIETWPDFIDGHAHLGAALLEQGKPGKALEAYAKGIALGDAAIPEGYDGLISWGWLENRPYLRALHGAALCHARRRRRKDAVALMEKLLRYNPNDNQGVRLLLGSEYLRLEKLALARPILEENAAHYPPCHYELGLLHLEQANMSAAATHLRRGFLTIPYITEILCGNPEPLALNIWHGSNLHDRETAASYAAMYGDYWRRRPDSVRFLHWLFNHPTVMRERADYQEVQVELLWEREPAARGNILERMDAVAARIDDKSSAQIVARRRDERSEEIAPWLDPRRSYRGGY